MVCALPLAVVGTALDPDDTPAPEALSRRFRPGMIPVLDGRRLLTGRPGGRSGLWLRLGPAGRPAGLVLLIDRLEPEDADAGDLWQPPPSLPVGAAALIQAVRWDETHRIWVLRLNPALRFTALPMIAKKAVAAALIGWLPADGCPPAAI